MESIRYIRDVVHLLQPKEKRTLMGILFVNLGQAFWEMCSISMLLPYLYIVLDCESAKQHSVLAMVYDWPFLRSDIRFILFLSLLILVLYAMRSGYLIFSVWFVNRKTVRFRKNFAVRLYRYYLTRPYPFYFQSNHTQLQRNINQISSTVVDKILLAGVNLIRMAVTGICILVMLVWIDKEFTGIILLVMGSICFCLYQKVKRMARETSAEGNRVWKQVHKTVLEYLKGIKEVRLMQLQPSIVHQYEQARTRLEQTIVRLDLLNAIPSQILEMCVIVSVLMIVILNAVRGRTVQESIAVIGVFAMAAVRIKPIIMGVYSQFLSLQSSLTYFQDVEAESLLEKEKAVSRAPGEIAFEQVSYTYPGTDKRVLSDVSVTIHQGELVGISGPSGGGKSTFLDLLLGLLIPEEGRITADGAAITGREAGWYPLIGYVPQEIYLLDDTIERNIVFDPEEQPDEKQLKQALEQAELLSYVHTLPEGLQARVGDGGIALSGGQKQRLGIARMLYRNPEIMVFDEATSALDVETERSVLRNILQKSPGRTFIITTHRPTVLSMCDRVYRVVEKKITKLGDEEVESIVRNF